MSTRTEAELSSSRSAMARAPSPRSYAGSCHCGAVRFEATLDLHAGVSKCNCSICLRTNFLGARVKPADMKVVSGQDALTDYQFNSNSVHHMFCKHCGVRPFGHANVPQAGGEYFSVNVHCLDGVELDGVPVKYCDGRNNSWWTDAKPFP